MNKETKVNSNKTVVTKEEPLATKGKSRLNVFMWPVLLIISLSVTIYMVYFYGEDEAVQDTQQLAKYATIEDLKQAEGNILRKLEQNKINEDSSTYEVDKHNSLNEYTDKDKIINRYKIASLAYKIQHKVNSLKNIDNDLNVLKSLLLNDFNEDLNNLVLYSSSFKNDLENIVNSINELIISEKTRTNNPQNVWEAFFKIKKHDEVSIVHSKLKLLESALSQISESNFKYALIELKNINGDTNIDELKNGMSLLIAAQQACINILNSTLIYD